MNIRNDSIKFGILLSKLFPNVRFFADNISHSGIISAGTDSDLFLFLRENTETATNEMSLSMLLLSKMLKVQKYAPLFSKNIPNLKEDLESYFQKGIGSVIKFFIKKIDNDFTQGYNKSVQDEIKLKNDSPVLELFETAFLKRTYTVDELSEPEQLYICEHSPASFYGAFEYYARRLYTLIRLGREFPLRKFYEQRKEDLENLKREEDSKDEKYRTLEKYYENFIESHDVIFKNTQKKGDDIDFSLDIIEKLFMGKKLKEAFAKVAGNLLTQILGDIYLKIQYILESTPENSGRYTPMNFIDLTKRIILQINPLIGQYAVRKKSKYEDSVANDFKVFSSYETKKIKGFCEKINTLDGLEDDLRSHSIGSVRFFMESNIFDKVEILYKLIHHKNRKDIYQHYLGASATEDIKEFFYRMPKSGIYIEDLKDEGKINNKTQYLEPEDELIFNEFMEIFANDFLKKEFNSVEDEDFIKYVAYTKESLPILTEELGAYLKKGKHNRNSHLSELYFAKSINQSQLASTLFTYKIRKAINNFLQWYDDYHRPIRRPKIDNANKQRT